MLASLSTEIPRRVLGPSATRPSLVVHAVKQKSKEKGNVFDALLSPKKKAEEKKTTKGNKPPAKQQPVSGTPGFGILKFELYNKPFEGIVWGPGTVALGMIGWAASFVLVGLVALPLAVKYSGVGPLAALSPSEKALYTFFNQCVETVVGISLINAVVGNARRRAEANGEEEGDGEGRAGSNGAASTSSGRASASSRAAPRASTSTATEDSEASLATPSELFRITAQGAFTKPTGWAVWAGLGMLTAPFAVIAVAQLLSELHVLPSGGKGTVDAVASIIQMDDVTFLSLFGTTAVLAPLLEEYVFRGFLLTSLTKFMPTWSAVLVSSGAFGLAHLSVRDLPQLATLGVILGFSYVRSRNLLTPMLIHGAWNGTVLTALFVLAASGVDVKEFIESMKNAS